MNPRLRRLAADSEILRTEFAGHPNITVIPLRPEPSDAYRVAYKLRGVVLSADGETAYADQHTVTVQLPAGYPRDKPLVTADTAVFHPNFGANPGEEVCIGDYWSPARGLADIIVAVGEMIQFQRYNVRSPLNSVAARWVAANESAFPVGTVNLYQAEPEIVLAAPTASTPGPLPQTEQAAAAPETNATAAGPEHAVAVLDDSYEATEHPVTRAVTVPSLPGPAADAEATHQEATDADPVDASTNGEEEAPDEEATAAEAVS
jgi:ubiquitin-protein ligase